MTPVASPRPGRAAGPPWELPRETGPVPASAPEPDPEGRDGSGDIKGLPRRVKQASLAPQLRADPPQRRTTVASVGPVGGPSPAEIRQTMSALQRGWQEGRAQRKADAAPGQAASSGAVGAASSAGPDSPAGGRADDPTAEEEARGSSDGS
jgi:hypothetical protein